MLQNVSEPAEEARRESCGVFPLHEPFSAVNSFQETKVLKSREIELPESQAAHTRDRPSSLTLPSYQLDAGRAAYAGWPTW